MSAVFIDAKELAAAVEVAGWNVDWCLDPSTTSEPYVVHAYGHPARPLSESLCHRAMLECNQWATEPFHLIETLDNGQQREARVRHCKVCERIVRSLGSELAVGMAAQR